LSFNSEIATIARQHALETPPEWTRRPWDSSLRAQSEAEATAIALRKLEALFDFAAIPADGSAEEIAAASDARFPRLAAARRQNAPGNFKRYEVEAFVRVDGRADWSYTIPEEGDLHGDLRTSDDLDNFIRNAVRVDLKQRIQTS
jgi:hypothetical protein